MSNLKKSKKTRIMLADDHPLLRQSLRDVLEKQPDFEVIAEASDGEEAVKLATAEFLSRLKSVERVDLLAYHEYGAVKYEQLGREYKPHIQPPTEEQLNDIKATFERHGLNVQLGG